ncbi:MAG: hypothetical protein IKC35_01330 [Clostridia bacterium]|nr:hypothetical protein [Clostridia bacterium]
MNNVQDKINKKARRRVLLKGAVNCKYLKKSALAAVKLQARLYKNREIVNSACSQLYKQIEAYLNR